MIAALLLAAALQVEPPPAVPTQPLATPPADWSTLPALTTKRRLPDTRTLSDFVRDEVAGGRCAVEGRSLTVHLAVHVAAGGQLRRIVPRAIDCPTVEQYASGLVSRMARGNVPAPAADTWYHAAMVFTLA